MRYKYYDLKQQHLGWLHNPNISNGQLADSKSILNLIDELEKQAERASNLTEALRCANELIREFNSYSTGCSCLAEEDVAELFGKYTEALEASEARQDPNVCEHGVNTLMAGLCNQCVEEASNEGRKDG